MEDKAYLTTELAEELNCKTDKIYNTFRNYNTMFIYGVDYFDLTGQALREAKERGDISPKVKSSIKVWSRTGLEKLKTIFDRMRTRRSKCTAEDSETTLTVSNSSGVINCLMDIVLKEKDKRIETLERVIKDKDVQLEQAKLRQDNDENTIAALTKQSGQYAEIIQALISRNKKG